MVNENNEPIFNSQNEPRFILNGKYIDIPDYINLSEICPNIVNPHYKLISIINHMGQSLNLGHYISYIEN